MKTKCCVLTTSGWHLFVKVHRYLWITLTGNDNPPSAGLGPISAVRGPGTSCLLAVCDLHYTLVAVHTAILALDIGGAADTTDVPDVFMDEGVEGLAPARSHLPSLHQQVAVAIIATRALRIHVLPQESLVFALSAIGGLHQPQPQQGQQQEQKQ